MVIIMIVKLNKIRFLRANAFFCHSIMPESPRWLLSNGKRGEAIKIVRKIADRNGKTLTEEAISSLEAEKHAARGRLWQLFSTKTLALRTCVIFINW